MRYLSRPGVVRRIIRPNGRRRAVQERNRRRQYVRRQDARGTRWRLYPACQPSRQLSRGQEPDFLFGTDTPFAPTYGNLPSLNGYLEMQELRQARPSLEQVFTALTTVRAVCSFERFPLHMVKYECDLTFVYCAATNTATEAWSPSGGWIFACGGIGDHRSWI